MTDSSVNRHQVLIVDPDSMIVDLMKYNLEDEGYAVVICANAEDALERDFSNTDLVISEVQLPDMNGLMLAGILKGTPETQNIPVILCSMLDSEDDIVKGLEAGADDYVIKPFSLREMMARIKAILRRRSQQVRPVSQSAGASRGIPFAIDASSRSVIIDGQSTPLTRTEILLLNTLMSNPGRFYTPEELYEVVWHKEHDGTSRALDVSVSRLRKKLGAHGANIVNRTGMGYGFIIKD